MLRDNDLHDEIFDLLMEHGADVAAQTIEGYTPLHYCVATPLPNMDMMVRMLDVADQQWRDRLAREERERTGQVDLDSDVLIRRASGVHADASVRSGLQTPNSTGTAEAVESAQPWQCTRCSHTNQPENRGACTACGVVPAKWFLSLEREAHRPLDMTTVYGETITSMAIKAGLRERVAVLLKYGPDLNRPDDQGCTMLMYAVKRNRLDLIRMVLAYGADIHAANYHGETALTFARDLSLENDDDILMMLTDAAGDLSWNRLRLGWMVPESEQLVSEQAQFEYRRLERMQGSRGSKVRKASRAKSRRRREGTGFKFDFDYGPYFGDGVGRGGVVKTESEKDVAGMFFTRASRG
jgi:ankyrin repeat protein